MEIYLKNGNIVIKWYVFIFNHLIIKANEYVINKTIKNKPK